MSVQPEDEADKESSKAVSMHNDDADESGDDSEESAHTRRIMIPRLPLPQPASLPSHDSHGEGEAAAAALVLAEPLPGHTELTLQIPSVPAVSSQLDSHVTHSYHEATQHLTLTAETLSARAHASAATMKQLSPEEVASQLSGAERDTLHTDVHYVALEQLFARFGSGQRGLTWARAQLTAKLQGENVLTRVRPPSPVEMFARQLASGFNLLLCVAAVFTFLSWQPLGSQNGKTPSLVNVGVAIVLFIVIMVSALLGCLQQRSAARAMDAFSRILPSYACVIREGRDSRVSGSSLVPGDLVRLSAGERVPADVRLVMCAGLQVDHSAVTGESEPVQCGTTCSSLNFLESTNMAFSSAAVVAGTAVGIVVHTGDQTVLGQVSKMTQLRNRSGPSAKDSNALHTRRMSYVSSLSIELSRFVKYITCLSLGTGALCLLLWGAWLYQKHRSYMPAATMGMNLISIVVAYVPEGLPICITLSLALVARTMISKRVLVRQLDVIETFNSVSIIATDKTGTLTTATMRCTSLRWGHTGRALRRIPTDGSAAMQTFVQAQTHSCFLALVEGAALCNSAHMLDLTKAAKPRDEAVRPTFSLFPPVGSTPPVSAERKLTLVGDSADCALYHLAQSLGARGVELVRAANPRLSQLPFSSSRKFAITVHRAALPQPHKYLALIKGAPEIVLQRCTSILNDDGLEVPITPAVREELLAAQDHATRGGGRLLALARLSVPMLPGSSSLQSLGGFCFTGMWLLVDPLRTSVPSSVTIARSAGIRVAMVTGDQAGTAQAIARQANIFTPHVCGDEGLFTLELGQDALGRAAFHIMRDGQRVDTHTIGAHEHARLTSQATTRNAFAAEPSHVHQAGRPAGPTSLLPSSALIAPCAESSVPVDIAVLDAASPSGTTSARTPVLARPGAVLVLGSDLALFDEFMWSMVLDHREMVFARTSPQHKLRLVLELQRRGEVVAVTGDGVNDAPALAHADLGVAMASGTQVARDAADLVLMDDEFASLLSGVQAGRLISDNLKKVCLYLLPGGTFSELWSVLLNVFCGVPTPLTAFQMIIVSVTTDVFAALALVHSPPEEQLMRRPPVDRRTARMVDWKLLFHAYIELGLFISFGASLNFFLFLSGEGLPPSSVWFAWDAWSDGYVVDGHTWSDDALNEVLYRAQSLYFVSLVVLNFFSLLTCSTRYSSLRHHNPLWGAHANWWLFLSMACGTSVATLVTQVPWFQSVFLTRAVAATDVLPAVGIGAAMLLFDEGRKWAVHTYPHSTWAKLAW